VGADRDGTYYKQWKRKPVWRVNNKAVRNALYVLLAEGKYFVSSMPWETQWAEGRTRHGTFTDAMAEAKGLIALAATVWRLTGELQDPAFTGRPGARWEKAESTGQEGEA
jgi:hypothetical protein